MNSAVYQAARRAGCTPAEAETIATYVESTKALDAAGRLGVSEQTVKNRLSDVRRRLGVPHTAAAVLRLLE